MGTATANPCVAPGAIYNTPGSIAMLGVQADDPNDIDYVRFTCDGVDYDVAERTIEAPTDSTFADDHMGGVLAGLAAFSAFWCPIDVDALGGGVDGKYNWTWTAHGTLGDTKAHTRVGALYRDYAAAISPSEAYVDGVAGDDSTGDGTSGNPWKTIAKAVPSGAIGWRNVYIKNDCEWGYTGAETWNPYSHADDTECPWFTIMPWPGELRSTARVINRDWDTSGAWFNAQNDAHLFNIRFQNVMVLECLAMAMSGAYGIRVWFEHCERVPRTVGARDLTTPDIDEVGLWGSQVGFMETNATYFWEGFITGCEITSTVAFHVGNFGNSGSNWVVRSIKSRNTLGILTYWYQGSNVCVGPWDLGNHRGYQTLGVCEVFETVAGQLEIVESPLHSGKVRIQATTALSANNNYAGGSLPWGTDYYNGDFGIAFSYLASKTQWGVSATGFTGYSLSGANTRAVLGGGSDNGAGKPYVDLDCPYTADVDGSGSAQLDTALLVDVFAFASKGDRFFPLIHSNWWYSDQGMPSNVIWHNLYSTDVVADGRMLVIQAGAGVTVNNFCWYNLTSGYFNEFLADDVAGALTNCVIRHCTLESLWWRSGMTFTGVKVVDCVLSYNTFRGGASQSENNDAIFAGIDFVNCHWVTASDAGGTNSSTGVAVAAADFATALLTGAWNLDPLSTAKLTASDGTDRGAFQGALTNLWTVPELPGGGEPPSRPILASTGTGTATSTAPMANPLDAHRSPLKSAPMSPPMRMPKSPIRGPGRSGGRGGPTWGPPAGPMKF